MPFKIKRGPVPIEVFLVLLDLGPIISEVASARLPDLNFETRQIRIVGQGNKERIVPFGIRTGMAYFQYFDQYRPHPAQPEVDQLFLSVGGTPMNRVSLTSIMYRLKMNSGVRMLHAQLFRHTFAVKYLMNGGDLISLQRILGHETLETTKRYLGLVKDQVQLQYDPFSPIDRLRINAPRRFGNKRPRSGFRDE